MTRLQLVAGENLPPLTVAEYAGVTFDGVPGRSVETERQHPSSMRRCPALSGKSQIKYSLARPRNSAPHACFAPTRNRPVPTLSLTLNFNFVERGFPQHPQPRTRTSLIKAYALTQPNSPSAAASHQHGSLESRRYHARCTHALAGGRHSHTACQTARAPRPRISIAASSRARYHARCTRALAGHALMRQHTQPCKCSAYNGPQPLTRTARPANAVPSCGPRGRAKSP